MALKGKTNSHKNWYLNGLSGVIYRVAGRNYIVFYEDNYPLHLVRAFCLVLIYAPGIHSEP